VWKLETTPFIQVTWAGTDAPIRQTVSVDGADDVLLLDVLLLVALLLGGALLGALLLLELLELQPAMASAAAVTPAAAPSAADLFLSPTAGTPSARVNLSVKLVT
jgi:hypothetical protein